MRTKADVVLLSETKLLSEEIERLRRICRSAGWNLVATPAAITKKGARSGGTAIMTKLGIQEIPPGDDLEGYAAEGRITIAAVAHPAVNRPIAVGCMYGYAGKQEEQRQSGRMLTSLLGRLAEVSAHAVAGGDFNLPPGTFEDGLLAVGLDRSGGTASHESL